MGLCLAGLGLSAMAEHAPDCARPVTVAAMLSQAPHKPEMAVACGDSAATAHEAAQLRLYDAASDEGAIRNASALPADANATAAGPFNATQRRVLALAPRVLAVARAYDIDPLLLHAIAHVESRHNPEARSAAGALGLLQVMPATARRFGVEAGPGALYDPAVNLEVGAAYLKSLQARFGNDLELVLAAYNAGEGAVERHGRSVPPYAETRAYVRQVLAEYGTLRAAFDIAAARGAR
jgi:soluble lytic murein transglycosylase-like protein